MKIIYGIAGFVIGIMTGLMLSLLEMKLIHGTGRDAMLPFVTGITVMACIITGVVMGVKKAGRRLKD